MSAKQPCWRFLGIVGSQMTKPWQLWSAKRAGVCQCLGLWLMCWQSLAAFHLLPPYISKHENSALQTTFLEVCVGPQGDKKYLEKLSSYQQFSQL